jgi:enoyl-[acyl-carrier protein] reductase III
MPGYGFIGASKAALEALARALAQELGPKGCASTW